MRIVIAGAGPAGVTIAETFRAHDKKSEIAVISAEPYPPYSPPAMADHFLTGSQAHLWRGEDWPDRIGVTYLSGVQAGSLDSASHRLILSGGKALPYDKLALATGSSLYAPVEGTSLPGVYNFKSLSAAEALVKGVKSGEARSAAIIGAGFIGVEIALLLRQLGIRVTQLEMMDQVMPQALDSETGGHVESILRGKEIDLRLGCKALAVTGKDHAEGLRLESGEEIRADLIVAATGVRPNVDWLRGNELKLDWGVEVDDHLRTNLPDVFAAGDLAETLDRLTGERRVSAIFPNAVAQGTVVGLNLAGFDVRYDGADRMNSLKHLGVPVVAAGLKTGDERLHGRVNGGFRTVYLKDNRLVGFQIVGDLSPAGVLRSLMNRGENVSAIKRHLVASRFGEGLLALEAAAGRMGPAGA
jgi:nitrite reductase (NADH) large subunit